MYRCPNARASQLAVPIAAISTLVFQLVLLPNSVFAAEREVAGNRIIEEITVTARKREERVIDTPVAVAVMTAEEIERYNTRDLAQLTQRMPGVEISHGAGGGAGGNITIRGIGKPPGTSDYGLDSPVSIVMDGMPFSRTHLLDTGFFDIQAVEVLKGPQALFFGKNSPAGVISITSITPEVGGEVEMFARAQYEIVTEDPVLEAGISFPVGEHLAFRLAARGQDMKDGWLDNSAEPLDVSGLYPGTTFSTRGAGDNAKFPAQSQAVVRFTAVWEPTDTFDATLKMFRSYSSQNEAGYTILYSCADGPGANPFYTAFPDPTQTCPDSRPRLERNSALPPREVANAHPFIDEDSRFNNKLSQYIHTLDMNWDIGNDLTLTSVTGYWDYRHREYTNYDYTSYAVVVSKQGEQGEGYTQELRLSSDFDGPLNFMVGAFYEDLERDLDAPVQILPPAFFAPGVVPYVPGQFPGDEFYDGAYISYHQHWENEIQSFSVFGNLDWQISERWELSGGLRYTKEDREAIGGNILENSGFLGFSPSQVTYTPEDTSSNVSPEVTLSYHPNDDVMVYAAYKTGFQSAGISNPGTVANLTALSPQAQSDVLVFDETTIEGVEVGMKGHFLEGRLRADIAAFWYESKDLQVGIFNSNTTSFTLQNAAVAHNYGLELQTQYQLGDRVQLRLSGQYNHLEFDEWEDAGCHPIDGALAPAVLAARSAPQCHIGPSGVAIQDLSGVRYGGAPLQVNAGMTYSAPLVANWNLDLMWDTIHHSEGKRTLNQPFTEVPSRTVSHIAATLYQQDGPWEVGFICSNCFNEIYVTSIGNKPLAKINPGVNGDMTASIAPPRLMTFQLTYRL